MSDHRGKLESDPFNYELTANGTMRISRGGKVVAVFGRRAADKLLERIEGAGHQRVQQALARATGHYKHGAD